MDGKGPKKGRTAAALAVIAASGLFLAFADLAGRTARSEGPGDGTAEARVFRVPTQADAYTVLKLNGVRGAHVVHVNRHLNLVDYFPVREKLTRPFPIRTYDIYPSYEEGIDSHTWLFVATRSGYVRRMTAIVPDGVFPSLSTRLAEDSHAFTLRRGIVAGYSYDTPVAVASGRKIPSIDGPVVMTIDAAYFDGENASQVLARDLRSRVKDVRLLILVASTDEPDVTEQMRRRLLQFLDAWRQQRG